IVEENVQPPVALNSLINHPLAILSVGNVSPTERSFPSFSFYCLDRLQSAFFHYIDHNHARSLLRKEDRRRSPQTRPRTGNYCNLVCKPVHVSNDRHVVVKYSLQRQFELCYQTIISLPIPSSQYS